MGALLAVLGVPRGTRRLLVLADGARWIREWFEGLGLSDGTMIVCWWHLVKRCQQDLSRACRGRAPPGDRVGGPEGVVAWAGR